MDKIREIVIVENKRLVRLLDLTADFRVKANKVDADFQVAKINTGIQVTGIQSCLFTVTLTPIFLRKFPDVYSLIYNFSE